MADSLHRSTWRRAITHPITAIMTLGCFLTIGSTYAFNYFMPSLLLEMGYKGVTNSLMTVPPNICAFFFTIAASSFCRFSSIISKDGIWK